jgi:nucleotide-binding universal stress UspA family protein
MTASAQPTTGAFAAYEPTLLPAGPIIVASDGSADSDAAFPMAQVLAARTNAQVRVLSVLQPYASSMYAYDLVPIPLETEAVTRATREAVIRTQLTRLMSAESTWPVVVHTGDPAHEIADYANRETARVVVAGRGRHGMLERVLAGETILRLLQFGDAPVLAVEPGLTHLPRRVVIATDFSEYSLYAARVALSLVAPDAMIHLVHVGPVIDETQDVLRERGTAAREHARTELSHMHEMLTRDELQFDEVLLSGHGAEELLRYANDTQAELIVSAAHGYGFVRRAVLGSTTTALVRGAACSVLCVPGSARTASTAFARRSAAVQTRTFVPGGVDAELSSFSERNHRRPCTVTVFRGDLGAQRVGHALSLVGATYDEHGKAVSLMFGASKLAGDHLTHRVDSVMEVDLSTDGRGRDAVLRIVHDGGYTLVELD